MTGLLQQSKMRTHETQKLVAFLAFAVCFYRPIEKFMIHHFDALSASSNLVDLTKGKALIVDLSTHGETSSSFWYNTINLSNVEDITVWDVLSGTLNQKFHYALMERLSENATDRFQSGTLSGLIQTHHNGRENPVNSIIVISSSNRCAKELRNPSIILNGMFSLAAKHARMTFIRLPPSQRNGLQIEIQKCLSGVASAVGQQRYWRVSKGDAMKLELQVAV